MLATGDGPLSVSLLYHDGCEVAADARRYIEALVKPEVLKVARGG